MFHQSFYPPSQFHNHRMPNQFHKPARSSFYPASPQVNQSSQKLNFSRDFERFQMPPHGFPSIPKGPHAFWRTNMGRYPRQYPRAPAFQFQDKSTFYYMSDPMMTPDNRITIRLTKVHIGPNGDQQRVFVEQEFSTENELKKFVKNLRSNFAKTFHQHEENLTTHSKKPSVVVIEEPDEEPRIYEQQVNHSRDEQEQRLPLMSSCSTIRSHKRRRDKMKYPPHDFSIPPNPNSHWRINGNQNRSRPTRMKEQEKPPVFRRSTQPRIIIAEHLLFTNPKQDQTRIDRSKSDCRLKIPFRNRTNTSQYFDYRQRYSTPLLFPSTPRLIRNPPPPLVQYPLFNPYQTHSNPF